jgi:VIT1/CCC1 family predicted Fe2+/Mn2+ transporter
MSVEPTPSEWHNHRDISGGWARAAVFGVSDGLVSNVSLILGFAGANASTTSVRLAGLAGLVAGAVSMAAGEYVSVRAQAELLQHELDKERLALFRHPEFEIIELTNIYIDRGIEPDVASAMARSAMSDPQLALETHAREELGINPSSLGSPVAAAASSFVAFAIGALLPVLPWFFTSGGAAIVASVIVGAIIALVVGGALASFTGRSRVFSALRQLGIAVIAAGATTLVGYFVG